MEELIKIEKNETIGFVINARDLHAFLEAKQDFSSWLKGRIKKYRFIENQDYVRVFYDMYGNEIDSQKNDVRIHRIEYGITLNVAKELGMIQNNERGRQIRKYFIEIEKIYKTNYFTDYLNRSHQIRVLKRIFRSKTYLLRDVNSGMIKIGKSINVERRFNEIKKMNPSIELILVLNKNIELDLHHEYEHKREIGEWFSLTDIDILKIKTKYHERIN